LARNRVRDFKKVNASSEELNRVQDAIEAVLNPVLASAPIDGVHLKGIFLAASTVTQVAHKLNRKAAGWILVRKSANANVWEPASQVPLASSTIALESDADVTIDLWVF
jgi:hypothetical protein